MEFDNNKPIYLQIVEMFCNKVLSGALAEEDRVASVREYGAEIGVNPNTVVRSYEKLTDLGVIYNKRGIGYYVATGAKTAILDAERKRFLEEDLPAIAERAALLGISKKEIIDNLSL